MISDTKTWSSAARVDRLDLSVLDPGQRAHFWVHVADGPMRPVEVPVIVARGRHDGPVLGLTAAVHGNELNGIPLIHALLGKLDLRTLRGFIVAVPGVNPGAMARRKRRYIDGLDLNHRFPGKGDGRGADVFAFRFIDRIASCFDFLLDLHTASFGRVNSLYVRADMRHEMTATMAYLLHPQIVLHNAAGDGTLRAAMAARSVPTVTVEIGNPHRYHHEFIRESMTGVRRVMGHLGMIPRRPARIGDKPILCRSSRWLYTQHGGLLSVLPKLTDRVKKGEVIARIVDVFGQLQTEYRAPHSGVIIGRSVDPVAHTGDRIVHLGRVATLGDKHLRLREDFRTTIHRDSGARIDDVIAGIRSEFDGAGGQDT